MEIQVCKRKSNNRIKPVTMENQLKATGLRIGSFIYFKLKEGHTPKLDVILWFGYLTNN